MSGTLRRVRAPEWLAAAAGIALLVALFLPWYAVPAGGWFAYAPLHGAGSAGPTTTLSAWQAFTVTDVVLAVLSLGGPALLAAQATRASPALPNAASVATCLCGAAASLLVIARLLLQPGTNGVVDLRAGAWIALAAALGLLAGAWWSLGEESNPAASRPDVELRRAPPAAG